MTLALSPAEARQVLADEWLARDPQTPAEINAFYRTAEHLAPDLEAFHADPARQAWTSALVQTAQQYLPLTETKLYIDIGAGLGHDLRAVKEAVPEALVVGVEPSHVLVAGYAQEFAVWADAADAPIETADLLSCIDVLEHVPEPETWLGDIARRAKVNAVLLETCATFDFGTPLHLRANAGWHPGRVLEATGWQQIGATGRMRYWQKRPAKVTHTSLMIAAYRGVATDTFLAIVGLLTAPNAVEQYGWRLSTAGEAGVNRARSVLVSRWFRETADDVFIMVDDDIIFTPANAQRLVDQCRAGYDIICGAYSVRDGAHMAIRGLDSQPQLQVGPAAGDPVQIRWASTGFLAVHRRVIEAMVPTLPLCHEATHFSFWPLFDFRVVEDAHTGGHNYLSEDWNFCERAIELGFKVWLDPTLMLGHLGTVAIHAGNMDAIHSAVTVGR